MSVKPEDTRSEDWASGRWGWMNREDGERILSKVEEKLRKGSSWKQSEKSVSRRRNPLFLMLTDLIGWGIIIAYWIGYHGNPQGLWQYSFSREGAKCLLMGVQKRLRIEEKETANTDISFWWIFLLRKENPDKGIKPLTTFPRKYKRFGITLDFTAKSKLTTF